MGLAPLIVQEIFSKIKLINKEDKVTVFVVEQNARLALKSSDDGYVMESTTATWVPSLRMLRIASAWQRNFRRMYAG